MRLTQRTRAEVPWSPSYIYECANGHHIEADAPVAQCPTYRHGGPCDGELTRTGPGGGVLRTAS